MGSNFVVEAKTFNGEVFNLSDKEITLVRNRYGSTSARVIFGSPTGTIVRLQTTSGDIIFT